MASQRKHVLDGKAQFRLQGVYWWLGTSQVAIALTAWKSPGPAVRRPSLNPVLSVRACTYLVGRYVPLCQALGVQN